MYIEKTVFFGSSTDLCGMSAANIQGDPFKALHNETRSLSIRLENF
jgi:hypothetical protein